MSENANVKILYEYCLDSKKKNTFKQKVLSTFKERQKFFNQVKELIDEKMNQEVKNRLISQTIGIVRYDLKDAIHSFPWIWYNAPKIHIFDNVLVFFLSLEGKEESLLVFSSGQVVYHYSSLEERGKVVIDVSTEPWAKSLFDWLDKNFYFLLDELNI